MTDQQSPPKPAVSYANKELLGAAIGGLLGGLLCFAVVLDPLESMGVKLGFRLALGLQEATGMFSNFSIGGFITSEVMTKIWVGVGVGVLLGFVVTRQLLKPRRA